MKIGIVTEWFERGSAYVSLEIQNQLISQGINCAIYARNEAAFMNQEVWSGSNVTQGVNTKLRFGKAIDREDFEAWLKSQEITHVIFNEQIWVAPVFWAKDLGLKTIGYVDYYKKSTVNNFRVYDALICNTRKHYSVFSWHRNCWYIPWGTDLERFKPSLRPQNGNLIYIHSGGWSPYRKGTDIAIEAFSKYLNADARLTIHLQISLEDFFNEFPHLQKMIEADSRIEILTEQITPENFYAYGDIYLYPTRLEGIGLTQVEALACGLPIIVPNDGPMNEFVLDPFSKTTEISKFWSRDDSYYWPMNEVSEAALITNIEWFSQNINSKENWSKSVREVAEKHFDANNNMSSLGSLLRAVDVSESNYNFIRIRTFSTRTLIFLSPMLFKINDLVNKFTNLFKL